MAELEMNDDDGMSVVNSERCSTFLHDIEELLLLNSDLHHNILSTASDCQQSELDQAFLEDLLLPEGEVKLDDDDNDDHTYNAFLEDLKKEKEASKNLVSERRRRQEINQRLYSLRAIVPNITKMDKISIVGDAISYVKELQNQIQTLQDDIAHLELTTTTTAHAQHNEHEQHEHENGHKILELQISKLEGKSETYEVRIECKKEGGVLIELIRALESESISFDILNAYITSLDNHRFLLSLLLKVNDPNLLETKQLREMILDVLPRFGLRL